MNNKVCVFFIMIMSFLFFVSSWELELHIFGLNLFDINISIVLLPMSFAFILMIIMIDKIWFNK
jgi:hypothetical protein